MRSPTRPPGCRSPSATSSATSPRIALAGGDRAVHARRPRPRPLHIGRLGGRRGRAQAGAPVPRAPRRARPRHVRLRWTNYHGATLGGLTVGGSSCADASTSRCCSQTPHVRGAVLLPLPVAGAPSGLRRRGRGRGRGGDPASGTRAGRRVHRRADHRLGRRRDPAPARLLAAGPRDLRPPRRAADPRRGGDRLRADRAPSSRPSTGASCPTCS